MCDEDKRGKISILLDDLPNDESALLDIDTAPELSWKEKKIIVNIINYKIKWYKNANACAYRREDTIAICQSIQLIGGLIEQVQLYIRQLFISYDREEFSDSSAQSLLSSFPVKEETYGA